MDAKVEFQKVVKDVTASAREFAALGLSYTSKALEVAGAKLKKAEETLKTQAEKLHPEKDKTEAAAPPPAEVK
jgi:hypothetical protein